MMDYKELGLRVGLEVHQQLDTGKLFCKCPSELVEEEGNETIRSLRATASEMGELDPAAIIEAAKGHRFIYQQPESSSCLVELDEEPPGEPNEDAMDIALKMSLLMGSKVMDEIHFMRKIVVDGSNTTGFQRTALVAMDGTLEVDGKDIGIPTICLEEDAARNIDDHGDNKIYRLDRLGIPLVEIVTSPVIESPEEAREVAQTIGGLLRATRKVKRGLGTIREDVNISITKGSRVEIKGVQDLKMLPEYVKIEVERQVNLLDIREALISKSAAVDPDMVDVQQIFKGTESTIIKNNIKKDKGVYALKLKGFASLLRGEEGEPLLGPELAAYAKTTGIGGIFHSDELPAYGITEEEVQDISEFLSLDKNDAFILISEEEDKASAAADRVIERAEMALEGVPGETRNAQLDGSTVYLRPISGGARMYPETDVPPFRVDDELLKSTEEDLPETPKERLKRYAEEYDLNLQQSRQLFRKGYDLIFEEIVDNTGNPSVVANTFLQTFPELEKEGYDMNNIEDDKLKSLFKKFSDGGFAKEGILDIIKELVEGKSVEEAIDSAGIESVDALYVREAITKILDEREGFVNERGLSALGPIMGVVMKELRGKADGEMVSNILKEELAKRVSDG